MFEKTGTILKISEVVHNVKPSVTPNVKPNVTPVVNKVPEKGEAGFSGEPIEALDKKNFLYFKARAISAGETSGPNGNGDYFSLEELVKSYGTFKNRGLYLNHDAQDVVKAVGKIIDAYLIVDAETKDIWVECLCKVDRVLRPDVARMVESGLIDSVSMGCTCDTAVCSVCDKEMHRKEDFCDHMVTGLLRKFPKNDTEITCYSINKGITFTELSLVSVPADSKAKIHELIASLKNNVASDNVSAVNALIDIYTSLSVEEKAQVKAEISKEAGISLDKDQALNENFRRSNQMDIDKEAGKTDSKQPEVKIKTTVERDDELKDMHAVDGLKKAQEKVKSTKDEQDTLACVLQKMNALDYVQLFEHFKKESAEKGVKDLERFTEKEYVAGTHGRAEEIAKQTKSTPMGEPKLKDAKKEIVDRAAMLARRAAGKHGEAYGSETPAPKNESEIDKIRKAILERVGSKVTSKLFTTSVMKEITAILGDTKKAEKMLSILFPGLSKHADAKAGGAQQYYWTGAKEPKGTDMECETSTMYRSEHQGEDVTEVKPGKTTEDYRKQVAENAKQSKTPWDSARESTVNEVAKGNAVEKTKAKLGFKASFTKAAELKDSTWTVTNSDNKIVFNATLGKLWGDTLNEVKDVATSEMYGKILVSKAEKSLDELMKSIKSEPAPKGKAAPAPGAKGEEAPAGDMPEMPDMSEVPPAADAEPMGDMPDLGGEPMAEGAEGDDKAPTEKVMEKLEEVLEAGGIEKMPQRKSDVSVNEFIVEQLEKLLKKLKGGKSEKKDEKKEDKKEEKKEEPKSEKSEEKKEEKAEKPEEKKEEKAEAKAQISARELKLESELAAEKAKASLREKIIRCRAMVEDMIERDMIEPDESVVASAEREGSNAIDARNAGLKSAIDCKLAELLKMDETSIQSFAKLVGSLKKQASQSDNLTKMPNVPLTSETMEDWFKNLPWS